MTNKNIQRLAIHQDDVNAIAELLDQSSFGVDTARLLRDRASSKQALRAVQRAQDLAAHRATDLSAALRWNLQDTSDVWLVGQARMLVATSASDDVEHWYRIGDIDRLLAEGR